MTTYNNIIQQPIQVPNLYAKHSQGVKEYIKKNDNQPQQLTTGTPRVLSEGEQALKTELTKIKTYEVFTTVKTDYLYKTDYLELLKVELPSNGKALLIREYDKVRRELEGIAEDAEDHLPDRNIETSARAYLKAMCGGNTTREQHIIQIEDITYLTEKRIKVRRTMISHYPNFLLLEGILLKFWDAICERVFGSIEEFQLNLTQALEENNIATAYHNSIAEAMGEVYKEQLYAYKKIKRSLAYDAYHQAMAQPVFWKDLKKSVYAGTYDNLSRQGKSDFDIVRSWVGYAKEDVAHYAWRTALQGNLINLSPTTEGRTVVIKNLKIVLPSATIEIAEDDLDYIREELWRSSLIKHFIEPYVALESSTMHQLKKSMDLRITDHEMKAVMFKEWERRNKTRILNYLKKKYKAPKGGNPDEIVNGYLRKMSKDLIAKEGITSMGYVTELIEAWLKEVEPELETNTQKGTGAWRAIGSAFQQAVEHKNFFEGEIWSVGRKIITTLQSVGKSCDNMRLLILASIDRKKAQAIQKDQSLKDSETWVSGFMRFMSFALKIGGSALGITKLIRLIRVTKRSWDLYKLAQKEEDDAEQQAEEIAVKWLNMKQVKNSDMNEKSVLKSKMDDLVMRLKYLRFAVAKKRKQIIRYIVNISNTVLKVIANVLSMTGIGTVATLAIKTFTSLVSLCSTSYSFFRAIQKRRAGTKGKERAEAAEYFLKEAWEEKEYAMKIVWQSGAYKGSDDLYPDPHIFKLGLPYKEFKYRFRRAKQRPLNVHPTLQGNLLFGELYKVLFKKLASTPGLDLMEVLARY